MEKKIKEYKFRPECEKYVEAYGKIINCVPSTIEVYKEHGYVFQHDSMAYKAVESAGVLDLWFEPVYEKIEFKIGDWVYWRGHYPTVARIKKHCNSFEDSWELEEFYNNGKYTSCSESNLRLATHDEIKEHLIKEAKRRGFKKGVRFACVIDGEEGELATEEWQYFADDALSSVCSDYIYNKGEWATILPKHDFKNGDIVYVKSAILGCGGADGHIGVVTSEQSNRGLGDDDYGVNVKVYNGDVWRVDGKIELATDEQVREAFVKFLT